MTELQSLLSGNKTEEIQFNEPLHKYFDKDNTELVFVSVTQLLENVKETFDKEYWGMYTALKDKGYKVKPEPESNIIYINGKSHPLKSLQKDTLFECWYRETIAKWDGITAEACLRGTNTHNYLEDTVNSSKGFNEGNNNHLLAPTNQIDFTKKQLISIHDLDATSIKDTYPAIYTRLKGYLERDFSIFAEKRLRLDLARIAGMIDLCLIKNNTNKFAILDWKTNKDEFHEYAGYYRKIKVGGKWIKSEDWVRTDKRLKGALSHLQDCKLVIYALQLSMYAYILECWGYELLPNGLEIMHIRPGYEPKLIKIPYLKFEIESILLERLKELNVNIPF